MNFERKNSEKFIETKVRFVMSHQSEKSYFRKKLVFLAHKNSKKKILSNKVIIIFLFRV